MNNPDHPINWSPERVVEWLGDLGYVFAGYGTTFRDNGITGRMIFGSTTAKLRQTLDALGVEEHHIHVICNAVLKTQVAQQQSQAGQRQAQVGQHQAQVGQRQAQGGQQQSQGGQQQPMHGQNAYGQPPYGHSAYAYNNQLGQTQYGQRSPPQQQQNPVFNINVTQNQTVGGKQTRTVETGNAGQQNPPAQTQSPAQFQNLSGRTQDPVPGRTQDPGPGRTQNPGPINTKADPVQPIQPIQPMVNPNVSPPMNPNVSPPMYSQPSKAMSQWSEDEVKNFIASHGKVYIPIAQKFLDYGVDGQDLEKTTLEDLEEFGIPSMAKKRIMRKITEAKVMSHSPGCDQLEEAQGGDNIERSQGDDWVDVEARKGVAQDSVDEIGDAENAKNDEEVNKEGDSQ